ncbi:methyltransferase domain-containing protein [Gloeothece verrucosa]|uniref:methyltransferase domain-containing protein n=1 Tax=Gloeothece verrucosa TaxID=2546359 RepID=UPI0002E3A20F|nr:methyltransferase domain-containing protein [Gloeothece verrucosa]
MVAKKVLSSEYWEQCYLQGKTRWDTGQPAPPFVSLLKSSQAPTPGTLAVLGSGNGHDALLFAEHGFEVVGFDFAPSAIANSTSNARSRCLSAEFLQRNIFELEAEFSNCFDYVLEHGCFCSFIPELRPRYVQIVHSLLRPDGLLIALFLVKGKRDRPPFGIELTNLLLLFDDYFEPLTLSLALSPFRSRKGPKYLASFRVKKSANPVNSQLLPVGLWTKFN